jgi:ubiquinone/menaquinone biosynthesis C-methylase UbiE
MRARLQKKLAPLAISHEVVDASAESLPFPDQSFDAVVITLVLCSVIHPEKSLAEINRVLKPGGKLALIEHVGAPARTLTLKWQKRIEPFWRSCAGNCHLTRDTRATVEAGGFNCDNLKHDSMCGAVALVAPTIRGLAEKV